MTYKREKAGEVRENLWTAFTAEKEKRKAAEYEAAV